jgi:apolipoprotein N-acyltransferase
MAKDYASWLMLLGGPMFLLAFVFGLAGQLTYTPLQIAFSGVLGVGGLLLAYLSFTEAE